MASPSATRTSLRDRSGTPDDAVDSTPQRPDERILYVDDDQHAREAFADAALALGFYVDTADGGDEALMLASRHRYGVIAADLRMPVLNGLSLIQLLRPKCPTTSYLIVTGASHLDLPAQANGEPLVDAVVSKPWSVGELSEILRVALERFRERRAASGAAPHSLPLLVVGSNFEKTAALRQLALEGQPESECLEANDVPSAVQMLERRSFRSAVVALDLSNDADLETIESLRCSAPDLPILVVGNRDDEATLNRIHKAGAQDYLVDTKVDAYNLRRAIRQAFERRILEDRLKFLSHRDPVTGLANRTALREKLSQAVLRARARDSKLALLLLDLDRFKSVNDSLGHDTGDRLLEVVAERLRENLRDVDTAARLGGDEFAIVLEEIQDPSEAVATAQRLLEALTPPARLNQYEIASTGSIGIALYPNHGETPGELLQFADRAMYRAKREGRDGYRLYSDEEEESRSRVLERLRFESGIRHALERQEYVVFFQPQLTLDRKRLVAMEALVRWNHPNAGLVLPGQFMPFLESSGLIKGVGEWVLKTACRQATAWRDEITADIRVSVNLSARQFEGTDLVATVERALHDSALPAHYLELEITESLLMKDTERTRVTLHELKSLGVRIAIDDFGTGYSSLAYLTTFPLDCLKIDRRFVHDITTNSDDRTVAEAIIGLGHSLRLDVVAEGVETEAQLARLKGCDGFQGFLISRPKPPSEARDLLRAYL